MSKGFFICLEGPDGSGKTTQAVRLRDNLIGQGYQVILTREPGSSTIGEAVRSLLLDRGDVQLDPKSELMLLMADRIQHLKEVIVPALEAGVTVISDRYIDSSIAYQGYGRGLDVSVVKSICNWGTEGLTPDLTVYTRVNRKVAVQRIQTRGQIDKIESLGEDFFARVEQGFNEIIATQVGAKLVLPDTCSIYEIEAIVLNRVLELLKSERN